MMTSNMLRAVAVFGLLAGASGAALADSAGAGSGNGGSASGNSGGSTTGAYTRNGPDTGAPPTSVPSANGNTVLMPSNDGCPTGSGGTGSNGGHSGPTVGNCQQ